MRFPYDSYQDARFRLFTQIYHLPELAPHIIALQYALMATPPYDPFRPQPSVGVHRHAEKDGRLYQAYPLHRPGAQHDLPYGQRLG
jgi:hypothetical protein